MSFKSILLFFLLSKTANHYTCCFTLLMVSYSGGPLWATFRWAAPGRDNGVILGYEVECWAERKPPAAPRRSACADTHLSPSHTQLVLRDLTPQTTYYFRVSFVLILPAAPSTACRRSADFLYLPILSLISVNMTTWLKTARNTYLNIKFNIQY